MKKMWVLALVQLSLCSEGLWAQPVGTELKPIGESFVDHFSRISRSRWIVAHGWSNGDHQGCSWSNKNVRLSSAVELLLNERPGKKQAFTCAEMQTTQFYGYGTYEARLRAAAGAGIVSAFFSFTGPPQGLGHPHAEINFELPGNNRNEAFLNYSAGGSTHALRVNLGFDTTASAHDYAFEWLPNHIRWFADGRLIGEVRKSEDRPLPGVAQKILLSIWSGAGSGQEAWLGHFNYAGEPLVARFEYVAFTRMDDSCQFPTSIVCQKDRGSQ